MRLLALLRQVLSTVRRDESGQSLVVVISSMTVILGVAGFGIDTANWMVHHHDAQVVADSAALAAAQCLAQPNQPSTIEVNGQQVTLQPCGSSPDPQSAAQQVAVEYAAANGLTITTSDVTFAGKVVTVRASTSTPSIFARVLGIGTMSQSAQAGAAWKPYGNSCPSPGASTCDFMFAADTDCTSSSNGIDLTSNGNLTVNGNIQSNSNLSGSANGANTSLGTATFGPGSGCGNSYTPNQNHDAWSIDPTAAPTDYPFPIDYSTDFPACTPGSTTNPCQTSGPYIDYPSYCTNVGSDIVLTGKSAGTGTDSVQSGNIYCAIGPHGTPSDPSTWDGSITIALSGNNTLYDTFIGQTITVTGSGGDSLSACGYTTSGYDASTCPGSTNTPPAPTTQNYPLFYATGPGTGSPGSTDCSSDPTPPALCVATDGNQVLNGDSYVPNGTAAFLPVKGKKTWTTFIEASNIVASASGTFLGDGPPASSTQDPGGGSISLVQ